ncbi:hypothetical protein CRE_06370 [Caenorhabditis remanei]|uniref:Uncharacterized protein n=1 Tax=Caenorhabditis remanei TaxID=31234 RepID=E3M1T1_CAERE|nr:hypothetical protein CRE_06370 [Caenorhabditis remanei]
MGTPFKEESLNSIMKYMDPNCRLLLNQKCSALKTLEKSTPLKIDYLHINSSFLQINTTTYKLGVVRQYTAGDPPQWVHQNNLQGGVDHDLSPFGECGMTQKDHESIGIGEHDIQELKRLERKLKDLERLPTFVRIKVGHTENYEIRERLKRLQDRLATSRARYFTCVRLTVTSQLTGVTLEHVTYNQGFRNFLEYFFKKILEGRRIRVKTLHVDHDVQRWNMNNMLTPKSLEIRRLKIDRNTDQIWECVRSWLIEEHGQLELLKV